MIEDSVVYNKKFLMPIASSIMQNSAGLSFCKTGGLTLRARVMLPLTLHVMMLLYQVLRSLWISVARLQ